MRDFDGWVRTLTIAGDEAYRPGERIPGPWHRLTDEEREHYKRDWMRRKRAQKRLEAVRTGQAVRIVASLHSLSCTGPTRATGCRCRKVRIMEQV